MPKNGIQLDFISLVGKRDLSYRDIWDFQKAKVESVKTGACPETIIFCEHERLLTNGRRAKAANILDTTLPLYDIERGGDVTYHGPGQLVIYPILKLKGSIFSGGLHEYLRFCEEVI